MSANKKHDTHVFYHCDQCQAGVAAEYIDRFIKHGSDTPKCVCGGTMISTGDGALDAMDYFMATLKSN